MGSNMGAGLALARQIQFAHDPYYITYIILLADYDHSETVTVVP